MFSLILIAIIITCLVYIGYVVVQKFPAISNIDTQELKSEQQAEVKTALLEKRFKKKFRFLNKIFSSEVWKKIFGFFNNLYNKILNLEKVYKQEKDRQKVEQSSTAEKQNLIKNKLVEAKEFLKQGNYTQAEEKYLEVIGVDQHNLNAYLGLAQIYTQQRDFQHAKETYDYILKLKPDSDAAFGGLGELALQQEDLEQAKENYQKSIELAKKNPEHYIDLATVEYKLGSPGRALTSIRRASELEPKNPKYLDYLIEAAVLNKNKILALDAFNKLKEINPENNKLDEFKKKIQEL